MFQNCFAARRLAESAFNLAPVPDSPALPHPIYYGENESQKRGARRVFKVKSYPHHIGDFNKKTRHLNRLERSIYRDLLDLYYEAEGQLTLHVPTVCRLILATTPDESTAVEQVLTEFFTETPAGWYHERCEEELDAYRANTSQKAMAGKASAAAKQQKKQQALDGKSTTVEHPLKSVATADNGASTNQSTNQPINHKPVDTPIPPVGASQPIVSVKRQSAVSITTWLESIKAIGEKPIPADDSVFEYADKVGIPPEFLRLYWKEFKERYSQKGSKRYTDWRKVFRNSVRGNWLQLWRVGADGSYFLTTQGKQAEMAAS